MQTLDIRLKLIINRVEAKNILKDAYARQRHNAWIQEKMHDGYPWLKDEHRRKTHPQCDSWDDLPENYRRMPETTDKELLDFYSANITKSQLTKQRIYAIL